ncbi:MAG: alpha/beta hydrolase [Clostridiales bacterium]|nr:alpha/beta hydrolase [Clostridiales bacterium]MDR2750176.1 alpha/beta hydrolase [Clostridiales bacterium]
MEINLGNMKANYIEKGEGDCVLFLHGWGSNALVFSRAIDYLSKSRKVFALDFPGFGESPEPEEDWALEDYAEFVIRFLKEKQIKKTVLIGHSFGGRVIIKLGSRESLPFEIEKIILVDSAGVLPKRTNKQKVRSLAYKAVKNVLSLKLIEKVSPGSLEKWRQKNGSADYRNATPKMRKVLVKTVNEDLEPLLPMIKHETLLIWGDKDTATPLSDGQLMEKKIPGSGLVVLKGAGHYSFLEQEVIFLRVLGSFLGEVQT